MLTGKKHYTDEFKNRIVELYNSGKTITELSRQYSVAKSTISGWVKKGKTIVIDDNTTITLEEYNKLLKKVSQLEEEKEILKKAMDIFSEK
ncbi:MULTISPECIES: transposase [Clostridium]|uniref:transposase n=1 Tax=Clostridium TaxID=1485 RepID=UPI000824AA52|nr:MULTISPECIES: transposase [Clostridium]PJI08923.1 hypothetical protein CUB90_14100 [Clostridium sp. CT7]